MITDADLLSEYEQAFNRRMATVDGIASRCHADGLCAVAAFAAAKQRDMEPTVPMLTVFWDTLHEGRGIFEALREVRCAAPLVTDKDAP